MVTNGCVKWLNQAIAAGNAKQICCEFNSLKIYLLITMPKINNQSML